MEEALTVQRIYWTSWMNPYLVLEHTMTSILLIGCGRSAKTEKGTDGCVRSITIIGSYFLLCFALGSDPATTFKYGHRSKIVTLASVALLTLLELPPCLNVLQDWGLN